MALCDWDQGGYELVLAELDCPFCLRNAVNLLAHLHASSFALQSGSLQKGADAAAHAIAAELDLAEDLARVQELLSTPSEESSKRMRVKITQDVHGTAYGDRAGLRRGEIRSYPDDVAARLISAGIAVADLDAEPVKPRPRAKFGWVSGQ